MNADNSKSSGLPGRSPLLLSPSRSLLLVIDVQERLAPLVDDSQRVVWNIRRLMQGSALLEVPTMVSEQYPQGLGPTVASLDVTRAPIVEKRMFSCRECSEIRQRLSQDDRDQIVICGLETHVCVQQTVLDLLPDGYQVQIVTDAVSSRFKHDRDMALRRMEISGAVLTTTEAILFEWCESSTHPKFKALSRLIREPFSTGDA